MSLRWKLLLLYALILALVIGGFSALLVDQLRTTLMQAVADELEIHAKALGEALEYEQGAWRMDSESPLVRDYAGDRGRYYVVSGQLDDSNIILTSPSFTGVRGSHPGSHAPVGKDRFVEVGVLIGKTDEPPASTETRPFFAIVSCGKSVSATDEAIDTLVGNLWILGPLVLLGSLAGGWFLVSRALKPIDRIARVAAEINETDLSRRIPVTARDEIGRLADTLNATFDRIQQGFERERRFTADASHELRTPLAVVAGNVEVALNKDRPPAEYRQMLGDIGEAAARMQTIVEGLLTLARVDRHTPARERQPVAIAPLCEDVVRLHRPIAERAGVSLYLATDPKIELKADAEALKTVVSNLVSNAIRYNHEGGRVGIGLERENGVVRIRVEDTGIGIPKEHIPHVFERFYRVDPARTAASGGAGLGLAIANAIIAAHHGTIAIESEVGKGTKVEVRLPG